MSEAESLELIQRFIHHLTVAGVDLHCPLPSMAHDLPGNIIQWYYPDNVETHY